MSAKRKHANVSQPFQRHKIRPQSSFLCVGTDLELRGVLRHLLRLISSSLQCSSLTSLPFEQTAGQTSNNAFGRMQCQQGGLTWPAHRVCCAASDGLVQESTGTLWYIDNGTNSSPRFPSRFGLSSGLLTM